MKVTAIGTGYVGLVTGTCLAEVGHQVVCVDIDPTKVAGLNNGVIPIYEPGLEDLVKANHAAGRLRFSTDAAAGVAHGDVLFIAVGTPPDEDGSADLSHVLEVARTIGSYLDRHAVIVDKSTVPVGTADRVRAAIAAQLAERAVDVAFDVISNPEFLKEGEAVNDCMRPDRIVIGLDPSGSSPSRAIESMKRLYAPFNRNHDRLVVMDVRSAELTKYAANAMLATKISFINEMANLCDKLQANINDVRKGIGHDQRIGFQFLFPGPGYGGSCFPKDIRAILGMGRKVGQPLALMQSVDDVNEAQKQVLFTKITGHFGDLAGKTFAVWGLAFKPRTDDIREAPALTLIDALLKAGASVRVHDPEAMANVRELYGDKLTYSDRPYGAVEGADALILVTEWPEFRTPDFEVLKRLLKSPVIFDGRNVYDEAVTGRAGFTYYGIGRGKR